MFLKYYQLKIQPLLNKFKVYLYNRKLTIQKNKFNKQIEIETLQIIDWYKNDLTAVDFWYSLKLHHESSKTIKELKYLIENSIHFVDANCDYLLTLSVEDIIDILKQHAFLNYPDCILLLNNNDKHILFNPNINEQDYDILIAEVVTLLKNNLSEYVIDEYLNIILYKIYKCSFKLKKLDDSIIDIYKQKTLTFINNIENSNNSLIKDSVGELLDEVRKIFFIGSKHMIEYYLKEFDLKYDEINQG